MTNKKDLAKFHDPKVFVLRHGHISHVVKLHYFLKDHFYFMA